MRVTGGVRFDIGTNFIVKAEYTYNRELNKDVPANRRQFDNDILTTSFTATF
jgi:opacity protein-like surface antigen